MTATFTTGLMGSGKSKSLIERFREKTEFTVPFAASLDEKTSTIGLITSRNGDSIPALNLNVNETNEIKELIKEAIEDPEIKALFIDEIQFLSESILSYILSECIESNKDVHFFGLETTFTSEYFEGSHYLLNTIDPDKVFRINMTCQAENCPEKAAYNGRIINGEVARTGETFVEAKSKYMSLCPYHYFQGSSL